MPKEEVFTKLIQTHQGLLFKVSSIYTDNKEDQEDLFQEIVFQLWKYFDSFRKESKISTWMYRVGMNTAITHLKRKKRGGTAIPISDAVLGKMENTDSLLEERLKLLYRHIGELNALDKGLMLLLLEGKSYKEMAEITGLEASNVGTRISRIKKKLKKNMLTQ
ncbi:RNA polymerase sigma factor [Maribacter sp. 2210JD10-5]|uniref:RNA polymerase sigma factor n=1 Tax=Maribacter sp. 2210JD10-5 TaxID=3386272 RepID=UPI0039BC5A16